MQTGRKYNILYVNPFCQDISGADESLYVILKGLDKELFTPFVAVPGKSHYTKRFEEAGAKVIVTRMARIKRSLNPFYFIYLAFSIAVELVTFVRLIKRNKIDLVHTNMEVVLSSGLAAKMCGIKSVYHYRHNASDSPKIVYNLFIKILDLLSDDILAISKATGETFFKRGVRDKVKVLYNAIELSRFENEKRNDFFEKNFRLEKKNMVVTTVGRINPRKNLEDFIGMASKVAGVDDNARFFLIGEPHDDGERRYKDKLLGMVRELSLEGKVIFADKQTAIPYVMKSSDIITISSYHEGFGRVIVEAMASERPVVGCDSGAVPEIMDWCECGVVYPIGDTDAFAKAVMKLLSDPDERMRLGETGKKRVLANFTLDIQRKKLEERYRKLLGIA